MKINNIEERLVAFSSGIIRMTENLSSTFANQHLSKQIIRSATSAALNYGEAQEAESRADFIHKMKVVLKELKETHVCLKILNESTTLNEGCFVKDLQENSELIAIFIASVNTARRKSGK